MAMAVGGLLPRHPSQVFSFLQERKIMNPAIAVIIK